jgi:hypothetical protein
MRPAATTPADNPRGLPEHTVLTAADVEAVAARVVELQRAGTARLALSIGEACEALGCGWDFWSAHVAPEIRMVRRGARRFVPVAELNRWLEANAERVLDTGKAPPTAREVAANRRVRATRGPRRRIATPEAR